ncbi:DUF4011 domain-containing protein [Oecophyllibacter saccharovorans]|nr:DUF4011 domain-containing protein [Oecophyllibacter saccharovorans]
MGWDIKCSTSSKVGFATHQNAVPIISNLCISASADAAPKTDLRLVLEANPPFINKKIWPVACLAPNDEVSISDSTVSLNATLLHSLTESLTGTLILTLLDDEGTVLAEITAPIELLASNQWGGSSTMAELLPAFVMPNDPAIDKILKATADILQKSGKPNTLEGYRADSRERVWEMASAIWTAIVNLHLTYALPPANFEKSGQKIRLPSTLLKGRMATCLDTALLFAAALEQAHLNAVIILTEEHALVGVWLKQDEFPTLITTEAAALRRRIDLDDLLVFETTLATQTPPASFNSAIKSAHHQLSEGFDNRFELAIDVCRARMQEIKPLNLSNSNSLELNDQEKSSVSATFEEAPSLPALEINSSDQNIISNTEDRLSQWQRKLLDLTTRNNLLNLRSNNKTIKLICPKPEKFENLLASGKCFRVAPLPELSIGGRDTHYYENQNRTQLIHDIAEHAIQRDEILVDSLTEKLDRSLKEIYKVSRTNLEEGGVNTLFLALGFLKWKKSSNEAQSYRAPLILIPVQLNRKSVSSEMKIKIRDDEARFNLTLLELLRQDFDLEIPDLDGDLPKDGDGIDVEAIWRKVREAIRDLSGFEVVTEVVLSNFSFSKYLMWKDLVEQSKSLKQNSIVQRLIKGGNTENSDHYKDFFSTNLTGEFPQASQMDTKIDPKNLFIPLPADSSQLVAIQASAEGHSFVLDGPPGTGKSQTIANIIAHNLGLGKRILFVSEKSAALEVVQRRLESKDLGPFCLELHSHKTSKSAVLSHLKRSWSSQEDVTIKEWDHEAAETKRLRDELNQISNLLHTQDSSGWNIYRAIGQVQRDWKENLPRLIFSPTTHHTREEMHRFREIVRNLGYARKEIIDLPPEIKIIARTEWSNAWQDEIKKSAQEILTAVSNVNLALNNLIKLSQIPAEISSISNLENFLEFSECCLDAYGLDLSFSFAPDMNICIASGRKAMKYITAYKKEESALSTTYVTEAVRHIPLSNIQADWENSSRKIWPLSSLMRRKITNTLAQAGGASGKINLENDLPHLEKMSELLLQIDQSTLQASKLPNWEGINSDQEAMLIILEKGERLQKFLTSISNNPEELLVLRQRASALVLGANEMLARDGDIAKSVTELRQAFSTLTQVRDRFDNLASSSSSTDFDSLRSQAEEIIKNTNRLSDWTAWWRHRNEAIEAGLKPIIEGLEGGDISPDAEASLQAFETAYAYWFASTRIDQNPVLAKFVANEQEERIMRFQHHGDQLETLASRYIRSRICRLIPSYTDPKTTPGLDILRRQLQMTRPNKAVRKLISEMGDDFTRLAPCMLMSPLSVAQYLPADQSLFDLVIFDEASQITPEDAIGAIARGKQVIVAGDPKQMPPSNDFQRTSNLNEDDTLPDLPSILDECLGTGMRRHRLSWHYRSRHESLITFSNTRYYGNELITFPAPETRASAITWHRVSGVYTGGKKTNPLEAQAMVNEAVRRLRDPNFVDERGTPLSLGLITMNAEQMRLVEDLLDNKRLAHPELEIHFDSTCLEPVVVRNLETVQGDERDVILFGTNFGPTEPGGQTMSMNFGKLNADGGNRRLNVATTRARREMHVFTSFDPGMIDLTRTRSEALRDLKTFIEFADRGNPALAEADKGSMGPPDSPFEEAVATILRKQGWIVVPQIGVSKFKIDLGIVHPDRPGDFLAGIECDGATYHSAATARDRDKIRQNILEALGWQLIRVWSTNWWRNKEGEAKKLNTRLNELLEADRVARKTEI